MCITSLTKFVRVPALLRWQRLLLRREHRRALPLQQGPAGRQGMASTPSAGALARVSSLISCQHHYRCKRRFCSSSVHPNSLPSASLSSALRNFDALPAWPGKHHCILPHLYVQSISASLSLGLRGSTCSNGVSVITNSFLCMVPKVGQEAH